MNSIVLTIIQAVLVLVIAPFTIGFIRWCKARFQTRRGPSPFLPYWSMATLLKKEMTITRHSSWVFHLVPYLVVGSTITLACIIPTFAIGGALGGYSHFMLVAAILAIGSIGLVLGGMDVASTFGSMGSSREMTLASLVEPILLTVLITLGYRAHSWSLDGMVAAYQTLPWYVASPALVVSILALILVILAENARYPVDNPATHLELTMVHEAMILEYSGPYLAMVEYASSLKLTLLALFLMNVVFPIGLVSVGSSALGFLTGLLAMILKVVIAGAGVAFLESVIVKMRFYRMQEYMMTAYLVALVGFFLAIVS